ncbi:MAG TPA: hypothetical protein VK034_00440 [Enhygromyxa sp.]|nr:hypothetical protein [Enhygromyxa sp.]
MKRITLFLSFSFACVLGSMACADDPAVSCDVVWSANSMEVGRATIVYDGIDDVDAALEMCLEDQATHESRPDTAMMHNCNCSN